MKKSEFKFRRQKLMDIIGIGGIAILPSTFLQNFYYITGFSQDAIAIIIPQREQGQYILFCQNNLEIYDADDIFSISDIDDIIPGLLETCQRLYYPIGYDSDFDKKIITWINTLKNQIYSNAPSELLALDHILYEMRLYKTEAEATAMRAASQVLVQAYKRAMQFCHHDLYKYELEAEIVHELIRNGCSYPPYPITIVGGNYKFNDKDAVLEDNDLVKIDAGVRLENYAATITRTFPINGHFSKFQKLIYEIVFKAQHAAIKKIYPGNNWIEPHTAAVEIITEELIKLGLLIGKFNILIEEEAYKRFYPQKTCYWLGLDIYDNCDYKVNETWRDLEPNMVMSVEAGIYIPPAEDIAEEWWNIGICIKDNILITSAGHEVLTIDLPKARAEIEKFMAAT
ncbi:MAG: M24 family metallopeptidase [Proteobacteria bacterium]|nr:M24 family metallopeptidase [Pseudomonadota bacterium]